MSAEGYSMLPGWHILLCPPEGMFPCPHMAGGGMEGPNWISALIRRSSTGEGRSLMSPSPMKAPPLKVVTLGN